jgi:uncharacterized membrane protein
MECYMVKHERTGLVVETEQQYIKAIEELSTNHEKRTTLGKQAKQRSVHNTYFTLPVLFAMLSNHYSFTYSNAHNWLVLIALMAAGAAIRQFFVLRHGFKLARNPHPWPYAVVGVAAILGVVVALAPAPVARGAAQSNLPLGYATLQPILAQRCYPCHAEQVQMKNVRLDSPQAVATHAMGIYQQAVVTRVMPMNNATQITEVERDTLKRWFEAGAKLD